MYTYIIQAHSVFSFNGEVIKHHTLNKKVKEISENHGTKEHQNKQIFNFVYTEGF